MQISGSRDGLYDPAFEHDACGVGFIVNMRGQPSREIVQRGLDILKNLEHRGACGCDPQTGDGAGILTQMPHRFFAEICRDLGVRLPEPGAYGVGTVFLPRKEEERAWCEAALERFTAEEGQQFLCWRDVPVRNELLGRVARAVEPVIRQVNPRGETIYWIGPAGDAREGGEGTDFFAVASGRVSVTPLQVDLTDHAALPGWRTLLEAAR